MATSATVRLINQHYVTQAAYKTVLSFAIKAKPEVLDKIFTAINQHSRTKIPPTLGVSLKNWGLEGVSEKDACNIFRAILVKGSPASQGPSKSPVSIQGGLFRKV